MSETMQEGIVMFDRLFRIGRGWGLWIPVVCVCVVVGTLVVVAAPEPPPEVALLIVIVSMATMNAARAAPARMRFTTS